MLKFAYYQIFVFSNTFSVQSYSYPHHPQYWHREVVEPATLSEKLKTIKNSLYVWGRRVSDCTIFLVSFKITCHLDVITKDEGDTLKFIFEQVFCGIFQHSIATATGQKWI